jgi:cobalt/nickel transport system permease protein
LQLGAFAVVVETLLSGITALPFRVFVSLMQPIHLAIGVVEGIVTSAVLGFVFTMRPELIVNAFSGAPLNKTISMRKVLIALAAITVLTGGILSIFASAYPDGLEWSMEKTAGTAELEGNGQAFVKARDIQAATAFMPGYDYPAAGEDGSTTGTTVAGLLGSLLTCTAAGGVGLVIYLIKRKRPKTIQV